MAAAHGAAAVLARTRLWPRRYGHWQRPPRAARRHVRGRMRTSVVALAPNGFVALPAAHPGTEAAHGDVLLLASGRIHAVVTGSDGRLLAAQELAAGRTRVLGGVDGRQLVNTGSETAVVVRVTAWSVHRAAAPAGSARSARSTASTARSRSASRPPSVR